MLCAAERVWRRMARAPPVASSTAAYALGVRDVTCKLAALRSPDGWPPVHEQHWRGRTTKVRMSGRIAQTIVARHPLPLPENERFTRHPSPLATPLRREGASSTEGGASEARGKGAQTELPGQGLRSRGRLASGWERAAGSQAGRGAAGRGRVGAVAVGRGTRRGRGGQGGGRDGKRMGGGGNASRAAWARAGGVAGSPGGRMGARGGVAGPAGGTGRATGGGRRGRRGAGAEIASGGCAGGGRSASAASRQHLSEEGGRTAPRVDGGQGCRHSARNASGKSEQAAATARLTGRRPSVS